MRLTSSCWTLAPAAIIAALTISGCAPMTEIGPPEWVDPPRPGQASLLRCPTAASDTTRVAIGEAGGTISVAGHALEIPAGAVSQETTFSMWVDASDRYRVVRITPVGYSFEQPVDLTLSWAGCPGEQGSRPGNRPLYIAKVRAANPQQVIETYRSRDAKANRNVQTGLGTLSGYSVGIR